MINKRTIAKEIGISGVGIHSGEKVNLLLKPSYSGQIIFRRKDKQDLVFELDVRSVRAKNSTFLVKGDYTILTVEHLLATLYVLGVDSLDIELEGGEIPILDGSASPFVEMILSAGIKDISLSKKSIRILKTFTLEDKDSSVYFSPGEDFIVSYAIEYPHPLIKKQELALSLSLKNFIEGIAPARTFGFLKDVPYLFRQGLALGGSLENAIVLDDEGVVNGPLRFSDEFVRHKILDFIGDLSLIGAPLLGNFRAYKAGHGLHLKLVQFLFDNPSFWRCEGETFPSFLQG